MTGPSSTPEREPFPLGAVVLLPLLALLVIVVGADGAARAAGLLPLGLIPVLLLRRARKVGDSVVVAASAVAWGALTFALLRAVPGARDADALTLLGTFALGAGGAMQATHLRLVARDGSAGRARALAVLVAGLLLGAWGARSLAVLLSAATGVVAPGVVALAAAAYALHAVRLVLRLAARGGLTSAPGGALGWLRANALPLGAGVLVLVAYFAFRGDLERSVPFFPALEFGLGVAAFGFAVSLVRGRVRARLAEAPVASPRGRHASRVDVRPEPGYEDVRRAVEAFVETGRGARDYSEAVRASTGLAEPAAAEALAPLARYRRPLRPPALPLAWAAGAGMAAAVGLALGVRDLLVAVDLDPLEAFAIGLGILGLGMWRLSGPARAHGRARGSVAVGAGGAFVVAAAFLVPVAARGGLASAPSTYWYVLGGVTLGLAAGPAVAAWRLERRLARGEHPPEPVASPAEEVERGIQAARRRVAALLLACLLAALVAPAVLGAAALGLPFLAGLTDAYRVVAGAAALPLLGFALASGLAWAGLARARGDVARRAAEERATRLALHRDVMARLRRTAGFMPGARP